MRSVEGERGGEIETAIGKLERSVQALIDGDLVLPSDGGSLLAQLESARRHLTAGDTPAAERGMHGFVDRIEALVQASAFEGERGSLPIEEARTLLSWLRRVGR
jgi:hypothetical protein